MSDRTDGLIIFVDSLRYRAPLSAALSDRGLAGVRYVPPLGFSANILPLLYRGKNPDQLGFFNEYGLQPRGRARALASLDRFVETVGKISVARKLFYRALRAVGVDAANIPMRLVQHFGKHSSSAYARGHQFPSLLEEGDFHLILASDSNAAPPDRDVIALDDAERAVEHHPRIYLSLTDLDSVSHEWGLESAEYARHESMLEERIGKLIERFLSVRGAGAPVVVLSDHGMAAVHATVTLQLEDRLGAPSRERYLYFLDSTLLRVWCFDPTLRPEVERFLRDADGIGSVVTEGERREWGITGAGCGDYLFVLHEGLIFDPNFIGRGVPRAMHGYHPRHESQHAVFLTNQRRFDDVQELTGSGPYDALRAIFSAGKCVSPT